MIPSILCKRLSLPVLNKISQTATFLPDFKFYQTRTFTNGSKTTEQRRVRIYTRTGDSGTSMLFNGERRKKNDPVFESLGNVDELNASIGVAIEFCSSVDQTLTSRLEKVLFILYLYLTKQIQSLLLDVGSNVATPRKQSPEPHLKRTSFSDENTKELEAWIDEMDSQLPPLTNFILPSGGKASSFLHVARAVCRRAERSLVTLLEQNNVDTSVEIFMNRLSDFLFVSARFVAMREGKAEVAYKKPKSNVQ